MGGYVESATRLSQDEQILNYLWEGNTLTPLEALDKFGCFRLGARIWELRQSGEPIVSELIEVNGKHVAQYHYEHRIAY